MKLIIPMAGMGKRLRPFTLATPKPLLKVAGKSIVQRVIEDLNHYSKDWLSEVHFVIGEFGKDVENNLVSLAEGVGAKGFIHYQKEALGTAHAVFCAKEALNDKVCIAFADTLYAGDITINNEDEAIIWTYEVDNPESYGVVVEDDKHTITNFVEKPEQFISNKAIVGMYYFSDGNKLYESINNLINTNSRTGGEFQLTDSLKDLKNKGVKYKCKTLSQWLDFGNPTEFIKSAKIIVNEHINKTDTHNNAGNTIIKPVYIGANVTVSNSVIGPNVIIEDNTVISDSKVRDSIIGESTKISNTEVANSMIGNYAKIDNFKGTLKLGDYNEVSNE